MEDGSPVLDPMAGPGVVLRHAIDLRHQAMGFDLDPLAVLMARVWTTPISKGNLEKWVIHVVDEPRATNGNEVSLDWMDTEDEARSFVEYWIGASQRTDLRRISFVLSNLGPRNCEE